MLLNTLSETLTGLLDGLEIGKDRLVEVLQDTYAEITDAFEAYGKSVANQATELSKQVKKSVK